MQYTPSPTAARFMASRKFLKLICGPVGGGKSTAALQALWVMALTQRPWGVEKIRRTKFAILRNTSAMLQQTVKPLVDYWFVHRPASLGLPPFGAWRVTDRTFEIRARLGDGTIVHTEFVLVHADTPDDVRRLLSAEYSAAWIEEAREVDHEVRQGLEGRVARFPNVEAGGVTYPCVIMSTNPPPIGTPLHEFMTNTPANAEVFMQPAALLEDGQLNPDAENLANLDPNYYDNLVIGKTEDWINVYLRNKFGSGGMGQPVFKATFRQSFHVAAGALKPIPAGMKKVIVGSDNGLTAAAVVVQEDARGRINQLAEAYVPDGETMGYERFLDTLLIPQLRELKVPKEFVLFVVDPACFHRSQANEVTIAQVIAKRGYAVVPAPTNDPERRIAAVETMLMLQVDGGPRYQISPTCTHTINSLDWGYRNKKTTSEKGLPVPEKNFYSHIADAVQCVGLYYHQGAGPGSGRRAAQPVTVGRRYAYA